MAKIGGRRRARAQSKRKQRQESLKLLPDEPEEVFYGPNEYTLRQRAGKLSQIITTYPQYIALGLASRDEAGWVFGRLYLVGVIDLEQRIAAESLSRVTSLYKRMLNKYYGSCTSNIFGEIIRVDGAREEDLSEQSEKRFEKVSKAYNRLITVLREDGEDVAKAVLVALETDQPTDLLLMRKGLDRIRGIR